MDLMPFLITLAIIGALLWVVNAYIPMDRKIKQILNIVMVVAVALWVCNLFGVFDFFQGFHIGK
ncbi:Thivi_2564 family membrane protein [Desulfobacula phenolica]|uniref:Uncharacterized protein n=1 Tax=Desulfobacula phenolica TaxID=90732 RepID=A0A1H2FFD4_9BACT|nr:Thivi_2564 family membrane protein [Desulfobacula phenolica]SDU06097.1 hypothetical protein SAMN04487931_104129 [Desulfobacula phenolica]